MALQPPPPLPYKLANDIKSADALVNWIANHENGLQFIGDHKVLIPFVFFSLAIEHHLGIVELVHKQVNGSAFALFRPTFEAVVRGAWSQLCATAQELDEFVEKDQLPSNLDFGQMVAAIEQHTDFADKVLSSLKKDAWKPMNSYTHGNVTDPSDTIALVKDVHLLENISHRIVLKITNAGDDYIDRATARIPIRRLNECVDATVSRKYE